ncbi:MAG: hypothetical protein Q9217_004696 [Psora testacea]
MGGSKDFNSRPDIVLALGRVESDKVELRLSGLLEELRKIINENRNSSKLKQVDDKGYHAILETVFRVAKIDISALSRASKYTSAKIASRLSACASLVRTIVDVGLSKLRYKTVKALVEHISQSLPTADAGYCEPLILDYFKSLATLLGFKAHVEHLSSDDWHELFKFCIETARDLNRPTQSVGYDTNGRSSQLNHKLRSRRYATPSTVGEQHHSFSSYESQQLAYPQLQGSNEDILLCIRHLISGANAPVVEKAEVTLEVLLDLLGTYPHSSKIQQSSYEAVYSIVSRTISSDTSLSLQIMRSLLPLIRTSWQRASQNLRETLLSILFRGEILFAPLLASNDGIDVKLGLVAFSEILKDQYCARKPREQLLIEDLDLSDTVPSGALRAPLSLHCASVRFGALKVEEPWATIYIGASICALLQRSATGNTKSEEVEDLPASPKRQKMISPLDELLYFMKSPQKATRMYSLQIAAFVFEKHDFDSNLLQNILESLLLALSDDDVHVVSWAIFALASAPSQTQAQSPDLKAFWLRAWKLIPRHITSSSTCRVACQALAIILEADLVTYSQIADLVDAMVQSSDLNGPAECDGAATRLWALLLQLRRRETLTTDIDASSGVLHWLYRSWSPATLDDRSRVVYCARHTSTFSILRLICCCLGISSPRPFSQPLLCIGRLSQTRLAALREQELDQYLLLDHGIRPAATFPRARSSIDFEQGQLSSASFQGLAHGLVEFLSQEATLLCNTCFSDTLILPSSANVETIYMIVQLCVIGYGLLSNRGLQYVRQQGDLLRALDRLRDGLKTSMLQHDKRKDLIDAYHESIGPTISQLRELTPGKDPLTNGVIAICRGQNQAFWERLRSTSLAPNGENYELDAIDLDVDFDSQISQRNSLDKVSSAIHDEVDASSCPDAFRACVTAKLCFASGQALAFSDEIPSGHTDASFMVGYLTSLQRQEFLLCGNVVRELLISDVLLSEDDADTLLQYIQQVIVKPYELERSEVSIGLCIDALTELAHWWTVHDSGDIATTGAELYVWFMGKILGAGNPSPYVLSCAANLLHKIIKVCTDYARSLSLPSARTTLFKVLRNGNLAVKYTIGQHISDIFGLFVLKEHDNILEDIIESLPNDPTWIEGIALRLIVLAYLAAAWPTVLRRCVYAIFEIGGRVSSSARYARYCLDHVTKTLKLSESQELFRLFAPQLIYTWLETQPLSSVPFHIFGYLELGDLLRDVQDEVVGQVVMRGRNEEAGQLAADVGIPFEELLERSFSKAAAYSIARDVAIPPSESSQAPQAEARLRKALGKEKYTALVTANFADIVSCLYRSMDYEDQTQRSLQKLPAYSKAYAAYQEIISTSSSDKSLPPNQQPSFKAKYLVAELEHLCRRTSYDPESIWSPTLYVHVFRQIINTTHAAFGSLHACSVLRKIRVLVCMAGPTALEGYPLEMGLHALRPYLTDAQCSDDAIGLFRYIVHHGVPYLGQAPSFLLGNAVTTLTSMKSFLASTQDSTTQESHFRATISKAQAFHGWLASFLDTYSSPHLSAQGLISFKVMTRAASNLLEGGSARKGTHGSDLLMEFLEDQRSGRNLLSQPSRESVLKFLSTSFERAEDFRDDVLGDDSQAVQYASTVWNTCQWRSAGSNYLLWSGRVLGRAYAGQGHEDKDMVRESRMDTERQESPTPNSATLSNSRIKILRLLSDLLTRDSRQEVGLAESALQSIVTKLYLTEYTQECEKSLNQHLIEAMLWKEYELPLLSGPSSGTSRDNFLNATALPIKGHAVIEWIRRLCQELAYKAIDDPLIAPLSHLLRVIEGFAEKAFPFILQLVLLKESGGQETTNRTISDLCRRTFERCMVGEVDHHAVQILLNAVLYLRTQPLPQETVKSDRSHWLDLNYRHAAYAANKCSLHKTALMFLEIDDSEKIKAEAASRRKSRSKQESKEILNDLLLDIFQQIDEQDAFYGVQQPSSLSSMMSQLEYEHAGFKSLSFRGAYYDGQIRNSSSRVDVDAEGMVKVLNSLDLHGLSQPLVSKITCTRSESVNAALNTARKLEQWDISPPSSHVSDASTVFEVFQKINNASDEAHLAAALDTGFADSMHQLLTNQSSKPSIQTTLGSLAALTEAEEVFSSPRLDRIEEVLARFQARNDAMHSESYGHIKDIVSCRETVFSSISKRSALQDLLKLSLRDARTLECRVLLMSSEISRSHGALQNALATTTYLNQLVESCKVVGVDVTAAAQFESAHVLSSHGEMTATVRLLRELNNNLLMDTMGPQAIIVGKAELLAKLVGWYSVMFFLSKVLRVSQGHQTAEARLQKPDEIIQRILKTAVKELHGVSTGNEAGEVFHEFASFCDQQLQNADSLEDFRRIQKLRERKDAEVRDLDRMIKAAGSQTKERDNLKNHRNKAKQWFDLDDREFQRLETSRLTLVRHSLENYLLCLKASDKYDNDALRFSALWLEHYDISLANEAVAKYMPQVPSRKFAALMNQWTSRLLDLPGDFQGLLFAIIQRICIDHPYHGMYQIFASSKTKGGKDEMALSRHAAANKVVEQLRNNPRASKTWLALHNTNVTFVRFAAERLEDPSIKPGAKVPLRKSLTGQRVEQDVLKMKVPPPTMSVELRTDCDYSNVTTITKFLPEFTVATGISMPKIITALGSDGQKYKQLFKGGNDDLRQDAIMEQVFGAVSSLLKIQRATHQRDLKIRTYKVLPLTATAGVIEFVPNTVPLHDYLLPAHQRHFPKDLKPNICRKHIGEAQNTNVENRIKVFRKVCEQFHPVLRYFFMERFESPDEWFERRLAYTRSTAAISILGHVLGLGDRHGHNILLDEKTGEVVHIDLGIAFEQGRVLPVPEVVPFRLTRDLVDGMGITGTEGVFRRCCEFTLEALRNESYSIMTILDVLRYDPLYSWSLSPLRLKKMQDAQTEDPAIPADGNGGEAGVGKKIEEEGEADRALLVVKKKLSRTLSVQATVNELIQAATDERNLAVLFCGWAAYA